MKKPKLTIIIAEVGECFNGEMTAARKLIHAAKAAGCDIVKFQTLDSANISADDPEREWFEKISLDPEKIRVLIKAARKEKIEILFTPENIKTCRWLIDAGMTSVKIASSCANDLELIEYINRHFRKVFISTGMATLREVSLAVSRLNKVRDLAILHCISEYPTGPLLEQRSLRALASENVRMNMMMMLQERYPRRTIGYSDHTGGILAPLVAVAMGARVIEKHITLDRKTPIDNFRKGRAYLGTDHILSLEPDELKQMVRQIREVETMFGPWKWERTPGEKILRQFLRTRFAGE